jgi:hypothetical protein
MKVFDKLGWLNTVQEDPTFTDREFRLAAVMCLEFTGEDGVGWPVELEDIAAAITSGVRLDWLKLALTKFRRAGYLVETYRSSPRRDRKAERAHNLSMP